MPQTQNSAARRARRIQLAKYGALILLAAALILVAVRFFFVPLQAYNRAKDLYEDSDFYQALAGFTALDGFLASEDWADDCRVMLTQGAIRSENYDEAAAFFGGHRGP